MCLWLEFGNVARNEESHSENFCNVVMFVLLFEIYVFPVGSEEQ